MHNPFNASDFVANQIKEIKATVGRGRVVCGVSGGVGSTVTARLIFNAIGNNLVCIFVNTGLLRKDESEQTVHLYEEMGFNMRVIDARGAFISALAGVIDPEKKRKIIGKTYIDILTAEAKIEKTKFLAQGSIMPDFVESEIGIKAHLDLIELLRDLFEEEVRQVAILLGVPESIIWQHPFPRPGLAIRIIGEVTEERLAALRQADYIFIQILRNRFHFNDRSWYYKISQAFCVLLPTVKNVIALRAIITEDFVTGTPTKIPYEILFDIANQIVDEVPVISRVVYDITGKPPVTVDWE